MNSIESTCRLIVTFLLIRSIDCRCGSDTSVFFNNCFTEDGLKILCLCKDSSRSNETVICKQSFKTFLDCYLKPNPNKRLNEYLNTKPIKLVDNLCKCLNESYASSSLIESSFESDESSEKTNINEANEITFLPGLELLRKRNKSNSYQLTTESSFDLNKKRELEKIKLEQRLAKQFELNNSIIFQLSTYFEAEAKYFILIGFLISLILVLFVWCILYCCQRTHSSSLTSSDLFISSTPINNYSPINSMPNISPISLHDDQTRTALLDGSMFSNVDIPNYEDIKPPSYNEAIKNNSY